MTDFRPASWHEYIGQEKARDRLDVSIQAALSRGDRMDHVFLYGPPGSGKTSLASVIAERLQKPFVSVVMPLSDNALRQLVMQNFGVVFLDEIHRASKKQQESLLTLVEDGELSTSSGYPVTNKDAQFIGATTERGKVIKPLFDRFPIKPEFTPYSDDEMGAIAFGMMQKAGIADQYSMNFAIELGMAAGGVPRNVKSMVVTVRDLMDSGTHLMPDIETVLDTAGVTHDGLTTLHVQYLVVMGKNAGNPLGVKPLATQLQGSEEMIIDIEGLLFQRHYIRYTKSGRELTAEGFKRASQLLGQT